jgi:hypothetical protein
MKTVTRTGIFTALCLFTFLGGSRLDATTYSATGNGEWSGAGTWSVGRAPADNDTIVIPAGITVNVDINTPTYVNMRIVVQGTLQFDNGQKINMCPGSLMLRPTGQLTGGTPGSKINICGMTVWNGGVTTAGPLFFGPVPAVINDFTATSRDEGSPTMRWASTEEEGENTVFLVERSENGLTYETIGTVNGTGPGSSYSFVDENPLEGAAYYRISVQDAPQQDEASRTVFVAPAEQSGGCVLTVYPNPCVEQCQVTFSQCPSDKEGTMVVEMIDANGTTVSSTVPQRDAGGAFTMSVDTRNNLSPGMYIIRGTSSKKSYTQKAILK